MDLKELIDSFKNILKAEDLPKEEEKKEEEVKAADVAVGQPLPDGIYVAEDGKKITLKEGLVDMVEEPDVEKPEEVEVIAENKVEAEAVKPEITLEDFKQALSEMAKELKASAINPLTQVPLTVETKKEENFRPLTEDEKARIAWGLK